MTDATRAATVDRATVITSPDSLFAKHQDTNSNGEIVTRLYRLSTGHDGVFCEGCHGSTHAIWPVQNPFSNDNVHSCRATLTDCTVFHELNSFDVEDFKENLES